MSERFSPTIRRISGAVARLTCIAAILAGCALPARRPTPTPVTPLQRETPTVVGASGAQPTPTPKEEPMTGLQIVPGSGGPETPAASPTPTQPVEAQPLSGADAQRVLDRLPPLKTEGVDVQPFRLPVRSLPAPRPGETITQTFPPPEARPAPEVASGPLEVLRYSPEGAVPLAPFLSVTFNQPMVALTTIEQLAAQDIPVRLSPQPEGAWRWVGAKTLLFEPTTRFPMATAYQVEIPAGTTSATGGKLAQAVTFGFTTPPPTVQMSYPTNGPHRRDPLLFVSFDQRIDAAAVLKTIAVKAGGKSYALEMAAAEDLAGDAVVNRLTAQAGEGRWVAFRAVERLPYDTSVTVDVGPGTPSAEGPLTTSAAQSYSFTTYGPLRVTQSHCGWEKTCPPLSPWWIEFSNPLDEGVFDPAWVQITPELPGAEISASGNGISIRGASKGRTTYQVTLRADIRDVFGQTLERDASVSFEVGSAQPMMAVPDGSMLVLDPAGPPAYSVYTINYGALKVKAYTVAPTDWPAYQQYLNDAQRNTKGATPPGKLALDTRISIKKATDEMVETPIDLSKLLKNKRGHVVLIIEPDEGLAGALRRRDWIPTIRLWVQATDIALDAYVENEQALVWANRLGDGAPLSGAQITLYPSKAQAASQADGVATLPLPASSNESAYLIAKLGEDAALLPGGGYYGWWGGSWSQRNPGAPYRWYVFDDRGMYRPGETVHIKGWVRRASITRAGEDLALPRSGSTVTWQLQDARGNKLLDGQTSLNTLGGFATSFVLSEAMNLGPTSLLLTLDGNQYAHSFAVQEFRRPEFEVTASASEGPHFVGEHAQITVSANYYAGGALPDADVQWTVTSSPGHYAPPNWSDFTFGYWTPWWSYRDFWGGPAETEVKAETFSGRTDAAGQHILRLDFQSVSPPRPTSVRAEASVMDVNRQAWAASAQLLVHPADLYVGLRSERTFVDKGKPFQVEAIVTDLDGKPISGRAIEVRAVRLHWAYRRGQWSEEERDAQTLSLTSAEKPVSFKLDTPEGGTYRITATIVDDRERRNVTQLTRWVSGGSRPRANKVEKEEVALIPDRQEYQPGQTAEILVQAPFTPAEGLMTLRRSGYIVASERFRMEESTYTLRVPIAEAHFPNINVQVDLVGAAQRLDAQGEPAPELPTRPAYATGALDLSVPPYARTLSVSAVPYDKELEPGGSTMVDVTVRDASGQPVKGAEVAVVVVDEAILALTGYQLADPLAAFYPQRSTDVQDYALRSYVVLADPTKLMEQSQSVKRYYMAPSAMPAMPMATMVAEEGAVLRDAAAPGGEAEAAPIRVRADFNPLAAFSPAVATDADGTAAVPVKLPDNLTRYRVMAVAVSGSKLYGKGESSLTARLPLMARPSPPRFLNLGDRFELPVVLQNQTDAPMTVDVAVRASNVTLSAGAGQRVTIPAHDRVEVRFPMATASAGTARFQVGAAAGKWADAAEFSLPVYTPATTEAFAVYGVVDEGAIAQPVIAPTNVFTQYGGLEISTSSTALQALTDAVLYLTAYPFECSEQLASRILAVAALRDVLSAFKAEGLPPQEELIAAVDRDIERLRGMQNDDGSFPIWVRGRESWPFYTIHVTHALARAQAKGFTVPSEMTSRALGYLREIERHYPAWYGQDIRNTLTAYALYVRSLMKDVDLVRARRLVQEATLPGLRPEALGWLLNVLADDAASRDEILRYLQNHVVETAGAATFATSYREEEGYVLLASNRRADGIILEAIIAADPKSDLIPKLVKGLLAHRKQGRWYNTQENVFILLALDRYFNVYEAQTPEFVARAWLGEQYVGEFQFVGRTTEYQDVTVPMDYLVGGATSQDLILSKEGPGRLYYRLGLNYAPTDLKLDPLEQGFTVQRAYEAVDDPQDVRRDEDGTWHVRAGATVRVRLTMVATSRRYHVALMDPLPAGFEAMNPALAVTGSIPPDPNEGGGSSYWWWRWTWYEHQNLRDQRAEAFASLLWEGIHTYTYVARATTPGEFVAPPAKAEEMYSPDVFGRSGTDRVIVE